MGKKQEIERLREQLNQWLVEEEHDNDEVWLKRGEAIFQRFAQLGSSAIAYNQLGDPETALAILDQLEGYHGPGQPNHYERITVTAIDADGEKYTCYTYVYPSERKEWLEQHAKLKA